METWPSIGTGLSKRVLSSENSIGRRKAKVVFVWSLRGGGSTNQSSPIDHLCASSLCARSFFYRTRRTCGIGIYYRK